MLAEVLFAAAFQVLPFYEQRPAADYRAVRPFWSTEGETTDVLWPLFTAHRDWWRFCFFTHYQSYADDGYQFEVMPLFWLGEQTVARGGRVSYGGLFPLAGTHPNFLLLHDLRFVLWPVWMQYRMPRPSETRWLTTNAVLWPFFHWRDDGSWGFWPLYVFNRQRESEHRTVLWPLVTWANYGEDRDTAGAGSSWMVWPLAAGVTRAREDQWLFLPPLFSFAETRPKTASSDSAPQLRLRAPWPLVDVERTVRRDRTSVFPFWERIDWKGYRAGERQGRVDRFGWKLVELYDDETRVFPFWTSRKDGSYFRLWPFYEAVRTEDGAEHGRLLALFPIRWVSAVDRNWAKFWTFYEREARTDGVRHSLLWGLLNWRTGDAD